MTEKRCFIAVKTPNYLQYQQRIERLTHDLDVKVSITQPEKYHFTLHFLGDISKVEEETVISLMNDIKQDKFKLSLGSTGTFPQNKPRKTKVLFIDVNQGRDELIDLAMDLRYNLSQNGFQVERRDYHPHLTVGRVRRGKDIAKLHDRWLTQEFKEQIFDVEEVLLIHSDLSGNGPKYNTIHKIQLA